MHRSPRAGAVTLIAILCTMLAGCQCFEDLHRPGVRLKAEPSPASRPHKLKRMRRQQPINANKALERFCGKRHIEFQAGRLKESDVERRRNNARCGQLYSG